MEINEIKSRLTITQILSHYGLKPDKNHRISCPFHEDKTPSMQVYPQTNTVYCFSSNCKLHGKAVDTIDLIMHKENITKHEALKKATSMVTPQAIGTVLIKEKSLNEKPALSLAEVFGQLQNNISKSPQAQEYLQSRCLDITKLEIGYTSTPLSAGSNGGLKHCIVFTLRDINNTVISLYGRSIYNNADQKHFYQTNREFIQVIQKRIQQN